LLPIPMELAPPVSGVVFICIFWTVLFCIIIIVLFFQGFTLFLFHLDFHTHVSSCVRGGIKHPKSISIILGCDSMRPDVAHVVDVVS
jgi:heme/copper-type cytochrome/quinol oxidase subunit 2